MKKLICLSTLFFVSHVAVSNAAGFDWDGFYAGWTAGSSIGRTSAESSVSNSYNTGIGLEVPYSQKMNMNSNGFTGGIFGGYNFKDGRVVYGVEAAINYNSSSMSDHANVLSYDYGSLYTSTGRQSFESKSNILGTFQGRLGYTFDDVMPYLSGGLAYGNFENKYNFTFTDSLSSNVNLSGSKSSAQIGWVMGAGVDYRMFDNIFVRLNYQHIEFGSSKFAVTDRVSGASTNVKFSPSYDTFSVGAGYKF